MSSTQTDRIDGLSTSVAVKAPCAVASVANLTLSGEQTVDGVALTAGDRVLVRSQTDPIENGIYVVQTGAWTRAKDFDGARDVVEGSLVFVAGGSTYIATFFRVSSTTINLGVSALEFTVVNGAFTGTYQHSLTGSVSRSINDRLEDLVFVTDFGAVGDGSTDDTAAIQAAIDSLSAYATLVFPAGSYKVRDQITVSTANITFSGYGAEIVGSADQSAGEVLILVSASGFSAHGFRFDMDVRAIIFRVDATASALSNFQFNNLYSEDAFYTVDIRGNATYGVSFVQISDVTHIGTSGQNNAAVVAFYSNNITYHNCHCRYAQNSAAFVMQVCTDGAITDCTTRDNATAASSDASIEIENSPNANILVQGNVCDYRIYIDDSTHVTVGPNIASSLRFTVQDRDQTSINCSGGVYGKIALDSIGSPGAYRTSANFVGITLDPNYYSETYGIFTDGTYVGDVKFKDIDMVSNGSSGNALFSRDAGATYRIRSCDFNGGTVSVSGSGGTVNIRDCVDYVTENSGTGNITNGTTSVTITHGLSRSPGVEDIVITPAENPTNTVGVIWVDGITSTQFDVNVENDPGASDFSFGWKAIATRDL